MKRVEIKEQFDIDAGAPMPVVLSNEHDVYLVFYAHKSDSSDQNNVVVISFNKFSMFKFGGPNDEAISGHKLYSLGLEPYSIQEILNSAWIIEQAKTNSVHPLHNQVMFDKLRHFVFFFHDSCFEISAEDYEVIEIGCSYSDAISKYSNLLV